MSRYYSPTERRERRSRSRSRSAERRERAGQPKHEPPPFQIAALEPNRGALTFARVVGGATEARMNWKATSATSDMEQLLHRLVFTDTMPSEAAAASPAEVEADLRRVADYLERERRAFLPKEVQYITRLQTLAGKPTEFVVVQLHTWKAPKQCLSNVNRQSEARILCTYIEHMLAVWCERYPALAPCERHWNVFRTHPSGHIEHGTCRYSSQKCRYSHDPRVFDTILQHDRELQNELTAAATEETAFVAEPDLPDIFPAHPFLDAYPLGGVLFGAGTQPEDIVHAEPARAWTSEATQRSLLVPTGTLFKADFRREFELSGKLSRDSRWYDACHCTRGMLD
ncbi:MAG: hypothetical protein Q7V62_13100, partial [Actinomycetota bacterium]|nr:hypothetical protein [Actinomycetota bacterium]